MIDGGREESDTMYGQPNQVDNCVWSYFKRKDTSMKALRQKYMY